MPGFSFDADAAKAQLDQAISAADGRLRAYQARSPSFPAQAAGRGFGAYGEQIAQMLQQVHQAGCERSGRLADGYRLARHLVGGLQDADASFAHRLDRL